MQLACIHFVVTNGAEGMSNASKLFYDTYELIQNKPEKFEAILEGFYRKYTGSVETQGLVCFIKD